VPGLAAALAVGFLIGLERGWKEREGAEGSRVAGLRTFALIGLLGGTLGSLDASFAALPLAGGLVALALLLAVSYREGVRVDGSLSATTAVAALLTFSLGALAAVGHAMPAVAAAVVVTVLLDLKSTLHRWLTLIEHRELRAALQMLVLSVVVLPLLPDTGLGPYQALNPYRLWWAVVLLAGLSLAGHVAMRLSGPQRGVLWTGLLGGLASSTAATVMLSRRVREDATIFEAATAGGLAACAVMFCRMVAILAVLQPALAWTMAAPLLASAGALVVVAMRHWNRRTPQDATGSAADEMATFDIGTALGFGFFLGLVTVLVHVSQDRLGAAGVIGLASLSGLVDVDAVLVSLARMREAGGVAVDTAMLGIACAAAVNMVMKIGIASVSGGPRFGRGIAAGYLWAGLAGSAVALAARLL